MSIIYYFGTGKASGEERYPHIEFCKVYQDYHGYMGVQINMMHLPEKPTNFSGPGYPAEYYTGVCVGNFNLNANPTTLWFNIQDNYRNLKGFEVISPRSDLGKNVSYHHKFVLETFENFSNTFNLIETIPTELAMERIASLSKTQFLPLYNQAVMKIREQKQQERIRNYKSYKEQIGPTLKRMKNRIALGTTIPEDWEPTLL